MGGSSGKLFAATPLSKGPPRFVNAAHMSCLRRSADRDLIVTRLTESSDQVPALAQTMHWPRLWARPVATRFSGGAILRQKTPLRSSLWHVWQLAISLGEEQAAALVTIAAKQKGSRPRAPPAFVISRIARSG